MAAKSDWKGALGENWARLTDVMGPLLGPFGDAAIAALGAIEGRRVLDLGCGAGASTFKLARLGARAIGVDVSPDLIAHALARRNAECGPARMAEFRCADAAEATFDAPLEGLFSQFGAMFFDEPVAAYAHLRRAMTPGAPLAIACWRTPRENEWATLALNAAKPHLPPAPPTDRRAPGPFAWSEPEESFAPILTEAGWRDVAWAPVDRRVRLGAGMADDPVEAAVRFALEIGPLASRLEDLPAATLERVETAVRAAMTERAAGGEVEAAAAGWVVTARA